MSGEEIKKIRLLYNLSQDDLAKKLFLTRQAISNYENGLRICPNDIACKIKDIFNLSEACENTYKSKFDLSFEELFLVKYKKIYDKLPVGHIISVPLEYKQKNRFIIITTEFLFYLCDEEGTRLTPDYRHMFTWTMDSNLDKGVILVGNNANEYPDKLIDVDGNLIPEKYSSKKYCGNGIKIIQNYSGLMNNCILENFKENLKFSFDSIEYCCNGRFLASINGFYGIFDDYGNLILDFGNADVSYFHYSPYNFLISFFELNDGFFWVSEKSGKSYFLNSNFEDLNIYLNFTMNDFVNILDNCIIYRKATENATYIYNKATKELIKSNFEYITDCINDKFYEVYLDNKRGLVLKKDFQMVVEVEYDKIEFIDSNSRFIFVRKKDYFGIVDLGENYKVTFYKYNPVYTNFRLHKNLKLYFFSYKRKYYFFTMSTNSFNKDDMLKFFGTRKQILTELLLTNDEYNFVEEYIETICNIKNSEALTPCDYSVL